MFSFTNKKCKKNRSLDLTLSCNYPAKGSCNATIKPSLDENSSYQENWTLYSSKVTFKFSDTWQTQRLPWFCHVNGKARVSVFPWCIKYRYCKPKCCFQHIHQNGISCYILYYLTFINVTLIRLCMYFLLNLNPEISLINWQTSNRWDWHNQPLQVRVALI